MHAEKQCLFYSRSRYSSKFKIVKFSIILLVTISKFVITYFLITCVTIVYYIICV